MSINLVKQINVADLVGASPLGGDAPNLGIDAAGDLIIAVSYEIRQDTGDVVPAMSELRLDGDLKFAKKITFDEQGRQSLNGLDFDVSGEASGHAFFTTDENGSTIVHFHSSDIANPITTLVDSGMNLNLSPGGIGPFRSAPFDTSVAVFADGTGVVGFQNVLTNSTENDLNIFGVQKDGGLVDYSGFLSQINDDGVQQDLDILSYGTNAVFIWSTNGRPNQPFGTDQAGTFGLQIATYDPASGFTQTYGYVNAVFKQGPNGPFLDGAQGDQTDPEIAQLDADGRVGVAWIDSRSGTKEIYARFYERGLTAGDNVPFKVSLDGVEVNDGTEFGAQLGGMLAIAGTAEGGMGVVWSRANADDGSRSDILIAVFDKDGNRLTDAAHDEVVATVANGSAGDGTNNVVPEVDLAFLPNGQAAVSWNGETANIALVDVPIVKGGTSGPDKLEGSSVADNLDGDEGNDTLYGFAGNDTLSGNPGDDVLVGAPAATD